jgi:hypothetical protein
MEKQRKSKRRYLTQYLKVFDRNTNEFIGRLGDISPEGIMLISEQPLETDVTYELRVDLPEAISDAGDLKINAKSLWTKPDVLPGFFDTGFQFVNVTKKRGKLIEKLIQELGVEGE